MSSFLNCPPDCPTRADMFDITCARREYPDLEHLSVRAQPVLQQGPPHRPRESLLQVVGEHPPHEVRGDPHSIECLPRLIKLIVNHAPAMAWGSPDAVEAWRHARREQMPAATT